MAGTNIFSLMGKIAIDGVEAVQKNLQDVSKTGKDTEGKLTKNLTNIANKAGELGKKAAIGIAAIGTAAIATVESTKEFRQDLGKLETAFTELADGGAAQGTQTFKELYAVLGEDDTSIEAANNLVALTGDTQQLGEWTNILTGVYAAFGDSLPIEGLAEAANETARTGLLTGGLTDAINWAAASGETFGVKLKANTKANEEWNNAVKSATTAEEFFALALQDCSSHAEREELIRNTLNDLYGQSAELYKENNKSVMDNNTAQAEMNLKMAETAEKIEPLITKGKELLVKVFEKLEPVIDWLIENFDLVGPIVLGVAAALTVFSTVMGIVNAVMMASPVTWIVLAIVAALAALVAIIVVVVKNWDKIKEATSKAINKMKETVEKGIEKIKGFFEKIINFVKDNWQGLLLLLVNPFAGAFKLLYDNCEGFRNFVDKWIGKIKKFFVDGFNNIKNKVVTTVTNLIDGVKNKFNSMKEAVTNIFNKVKTAITSPVEKAKDKVKGIIDKIKGLFNFNWSLPKLKLPHIKVSGGSAPYGIGGKGSLPKFDIDWYAKAMDRPMILKTPTAFGVSPSGKIRAGGEAGSELVGGTDTVMGMIRNAVSGNNAGIEEKLIMLVDILLKYLPLLTNKRMVATPEGLVEMIVDPMDRALAEKTDDRRRGR